MAQDSASWQGCAIEYTVLVPYPTLTIIWCVLGGTILIYR
jgi:hypothetical protein